MRRAWVVALLLLVAPAQAHEGLSPFAALVRVDEGALVVKARYEIPTAREAAVWRERFDRDGSGALEAREQAALRAALLRRAERAFDLRVDGQAPKWRTKAVVLVDTTDRLAVLLERKARQRWRPGGSRVTVTSRLDVPSRIDVTGLPGPIRDARVTRDAPLSFGVDPTSLRSR